MDKEEHFPYHYTFSQRYGYEPLPNAMKLEFLSRGFRRELCNEIMSLVNFFVQNNSLYETRFLNQTGRNLFRSTLGEFMGIPDHQVNITLNELVNQIDSILLNSEFHKVLSFLEILVRQMSNHPNYNLRNRDIHFRNRLFSLTKSIQGLLEKHGMAYRLVINQNKPIWFYPCDSEENAKATVEAIEKLHEGGFNGATTHLRKAADFIIHNNHDDAIVQSIHAVESVARRINPDASTLGPALDTLQERGLLNHRALSAAFKKLYGYTCDEEGLRHALVFNEEANVDQDESVFFFGACASFAGYLARKYLSSRNG